jgi:transcription antitermination factor NusG
VREIESPILKRVIFVRLTESELLDLVRTLHPAGYVYRTAAPTASATRTAGSVAKRSDSEAARRYAVIPDREMNRFRTIVSQGRDFIDETPATTLAPQARVRVTDGAFAGHDALVINRVTDTRYRVKILDTIFSVEYEAPVVYLSNC